MQPRIGSNTNTEEDNEWVHVESTTQPSIQKMLADALPSRTPELNDLQEEKPNGLFTSYSYTSTNDMDEFAKIALGKRPYPKRSIDELINDFNSSNIHFNHLNNDFQKNRTLPTVLFPALASYNSVLASSLKFMDIHKIDYIQKIVIENINNFSRYVNDKYQQLQNFNDLIENNKIDAQRIQDAHNLGIEFSEQMRRTTFQLRHLLITAQSFHENHSLEEKLPESLSATAKKIQSIGHALTKLHSNIQHHVANYDFMNDSRMRMTR
jgi:hypothetical protein